MEEKLRERRDFMKRFAMDWLKQWKSRENKKPVIVEGVLGAGKTWLIRKFGETEYGASVYVDFQLGDDRINRLFAESLDIGCLVSGLEIYSGKRIRPSETLIILDNIQAMPNALASLRCFSEALQDYHVICASSLLDIVSVHDLTPSLVGKVEILRLYPMSFQEFFLAMEKEEHLKNFLIKSNFKMTDIFRQHYVDALKYYFFVGGMPEAVLRFVESRNLDYVKEAQKHILEEYNHFFISYAPSAFYTKVCGVWESIPNQLRKENKKFFYDLLQEGGRAKFFEEAIAWLSDYGFVYKVNRVTVPQMPLNDFDSSKVFKLFMTDIGLLACMLGMHEDSVSDGNVLFDAFDGVMTEQYVFQQLVAVSGRDLYYYANERSACEISCLIIDGRGAIPVDVITKINLKDKRLQTYMEKFNPVKAVQISLADYHMNEQMLQLPLYAVEKITAELRV